MACWSCIESPLLQYYQCHHILLRDDVLVLHVITTVTTLSMPCCEQLALGNTEPFTSASYRDMCADVGATWVRGCGIQTDGLKAIYSAVGDDALRDDMQALGITAEVKAPASSAAVIKTSAASSVVHSTHLSGEDGHDDDDGSTDEGLAPSHCQLCFHTINSCVYIQSHRAHQLCTCTLQMCLRGYWTVYGLYLTALTLTITGY
jgi:hypothetical protein